MRTGNIIRTSTATPALYASSASVLAGRTSLCETTSEPIAIALSAATSVTRSDRGGGSRQISNRSRHALWASATPQLSTSGAADRRGSPPPHPATPGPGAPAKAAPPVDIAEPAAPVESADAGEPAISPEPAIPESEPEPIEPPAAPVETSETGDAANDAVGEAAAADAVPPAEEAAPKPAKPERVHLTIDSLQNYELIEPIPVVIDPLGDKVFVAETPDLNISITGSSIGGAFLQLKDQISTIYESLRSKKFLDPERKRQLKMLETYIGKPKRAWYLARD